MRKLFFGYLILAALMMWAITAGGGNPQHNGSWLGIAIGMVICQPWLVPIANYLTPDGDLTPLSLGLSAAVNVVLLGFVTFRRQAPST